MKNTTERSFERYMLGMTKLFPGDIGHEPTLAPPSETPPRCPVCGEETYELVRDRYGDTVGCLACVDVVNAAEGTVYELGFCRDGGV